MKLRFAPSPTGLLHVGNARVALANWLHARRHGGDFLLRLDDTDLERSKPEFAAAIEEDLRWLGLDWDGRVAQSERLDRYAAAAEQLKASGRLYPCFETEDELTFKRERRRREGRPPVYDREALRMTQEQIDRAIANGKLPYWRFRLSTRSVGWTDLVLGPRSVKLPAISDPVLIRADGSPLYTFTSVVDDLEMGITHVIRGEDHVTNTGIQLDLYEALGGDPARLAFGHLPLLTDETGGALSKRLGSVSLRHLRKDGIEPAALAGYLAALGSSADPVPGLPAELAAGFDITRSSHATARFDTRQLLALNRRVLHGAAFDAVRERLPEGADEAFWLAVRGNLDLLREARPWLDVVRGSIVPPVQEGEHAFLKAALAALPPEPWDAGTWPAWTGALKDGTGRKGKALFLPLRLALTGEEHGPDLTTLLPLIGRERAAFRLRLSAGA
ncbi:glutamate--tRNA ligase [Roseomonas sp. PWR1]|uniref:Glutamate--tRNA ligase n=1 Tax=Roseomonas nitratireducens TaxID=2820810 RepID=A0ABS4ASN4_9PROT|nr:glutamate--tRNA ligase [Neoroseomonas nitratireducens]MBP0464390.1 glutamate--tRNA ligase [Neoroseomonas nitratireducens]